MGNLNGRIALVTGAGRGIGLAAAAALSGDYSLAVRVWNELGVRQGGVRRGPDEKARRALGSWLNRLESIIEEGQRRREIRGDIDSAEIAALIVSTLEGSLMMRRLQRKDEARDWARHHLEEYLETKVRARRAKPGRENR